MKVSVIGGGGLVGSMAAFALQMGKIATDISIIDANSKVAEGVALDLLQGSSLIATKGSSPKICPASPTAMSW